MVYFVPVDRPVNCIVVMSLPSVSLMDLALPSSVTMYPDKLPSADAFHVTVSDRFVLARRLKPRMEFGTGTRMAYVNLLQCKTLTSQLMSYVYVDTVFNTNLEIRGIANQWVVFND
jgi:collagenase-like PrtC family protease